MTESASGGRCSPTNTVFSFPAGTEQRRPPAGSPALWLCSWNTNIQWITSSNNTLINTHVVLHSGWSSFVLFYCVTCLTAGVMNHQCAFWVLTASLHTETLRNRSEKQDSSQSAWCVCEPPANQRDSRLALKSWELHVSGKTGHSARENCELLWPQNSFQLSVLFYWNIGLRDAGYIAEQ